MAAFLEDTIPQSIAIEDEIREFVIKQSTITPVLNRRNRQLVCVLAALCNFCVGVFGSASPHQWMWLWSIMASLIIYVIVATILITYFPTPAIRVARLSYQYRLYINGLYQKGSDDAKDYRMFFDFRHFLRSIKFYFHNGRI